MKQFCIFALCLSMLLTGCGGKTSKEQKDSGKASTKEAAVAQNPEETSTQAATETEAQTETETEPPEITQTVTLIAAGDNLIHNSVYTHAYNRSKKTYDFAPMYEDIREEISSRDIAVINQETIFVADESNVSS